MSALPPFSAPAGIPAARAAVWSERVRALARTRALGWTFIALLALAWEIAARALQGPSFPALSSIGSHAWDVTRSGELPGALGTTLARMALGYGLATVIGVGVGVLMGGSRFFRLLLEPLIEIARPVPISAVIPLLILFFGIGIGMKVWVVFVAASFPIILNTQAGVASVPATLHETALTFGLSRRQRLLEVTLPHALPYVFVGLRLALAIGLIVSVLSEMIAGNNGIGYFILQGQQTLAVKDLYVGILALGLVGYLFNLAFLTLERHIAGPRAGGG